MKTLISNTKFHTPNSNYCTLLYNSGKALNLAVQRPPEK